MRVEPPQHEIVVRHTFCRPHVADHLARQNRPVRLNHDQPPASETAAARPYSLRRGDDTVHGAIEEREQPCQTGRIAIGCSHTSTGAVICGLIDAAKAAIRWRAAQARQFDLVERVLTQVLDDRRQCLDVSRRRRKTRVDPQLRQPFTRFA